MKLGLSMTFVEPAVNRGHIDGIGVYTRQLYRDLQALGEEVHGYAFAGKDMPLVYSERFKNGFASSLLLSSVHAVSIPVDVFHSTDYRIINLDCPVVATLYDAIPLSHPGLARRRGRLIKNWALKRASRFADRVICISQHAADEVAHYYDIPESKISIVPCGIDIQWLVPVADEAKQAVMNARGLRPGFLLFVGTIQPRKNISRVLDAYLKLPESIRAERQLVVVGRAPAEYSELANRLRSAESSGWLRWLDNVDSEKEMRAIYACAEVFVFPSLYEGFGLPVLEAFASGVPVVTSNTTSLPEVSAGCALEVDPESIDEIVDAIRSLLEAPAEREWRIAAGWKRAQQLTSLEMARSLLNVYKKVC